MKRLADYIFETINKKLKIAYVHGYGGSANGKTFNDFKNLLGHDCEAYGIEYDNDNPKKALTQIRNFVKSNNIDVLFGTSYGGWLLMMIPEVKRVVANPCFHPQNELIKWPVEEERAPQKTIDSITELDETVFNKSNTPESVKNLYAFFGDKDDFLGDKYQKEYKENWSKDNFEIIDSGHSPSIKALKRISKFIQDNYK